MKLPSKHLGNFQQTKYAQILIRPDLQLFQKAADLNPSYFTNISTKIAGVAGSGYETISGNLDAPFRIQRNHSAIQQRQIANWRTIATSQTPS
jgi:hypothetical protein